MATQVREPVADTAGLTEMIRVAVPERSLRQDVRAASIVWRRELIRFRSDRLRAISGLIQPVLFLFVLGSGLSALAKRGLPPGVEVARVSLVEAIELIEGHLGSESRGPGA
jgi:hypothetical protein